MIFIFRLVICLNSIDVQGKMNTSLLCPDYIPGSACSGVSHPLVRCFDKSDLRIPAPTAECQCRSRVLKQMCVLSSCRGGGSEGPEPGPAAWRWLPARDQWVASSSLAAPSMTGRCAGSATRAAVKRTCCLRVNVQGPWAQFIGAAWNTGCRPQTPATVNSATSGLQSSANPGR